MSSLGNNDGGGFTTSIPSTSDEAKSGAAIMSPAKRRESPRKGPHSTSVIADFRGTKEALDKLSLDGRSSVAKQVALLEKHIANDLGGSSKLTTTKWALVSIVARELLLLDFYDQFLFSRSYMIDKRRRRLTSGTHDRIKLADSIVRHMAALGLERAK